MVDSKKRTVTRRIDLKLDDLLKQISEKNDINFRQASKEAARIIANKKEKSFIREIKF